MTYGVDRLETSLVIYQSQKMSCQYHFILTIRNIEALGGVTIRRRLGSRGNTYDVNTLVPRNTNLGALRTEINTDNAHCRPKK
jgi:hypothetical protein